MLHSENCRCPECWTLCEYMLQLTGKDYGLQPAPMRAKRAAAAAAGTSVPTTRARVEESCDGSYTCGCKKCAADKAKLVRRSRPAFAF